MIKNINNDIVELHKKWGSVIEEKLNFGFQKEKQKIDVIPMFYGDFNKHFKSSILYVGINPSLTDENYEELKKRKLSKFSSFLISDNKDEFINEIITQQQELISGPKQIIYFKKIEEFHKKTFKEKWSHYDLFPFRATEQNEVIKVLKSKELQEFKNRSIDRFFEFIHHSEVKLVISLNSEVSKIIYNKEGLLNIERKKRFRNPIYGLYKINDLKIVLFKHLTQGATSKDEFEIFEKMVKDFLKK